MIIHWLLEHPIFQRLRKFTSNLALVGGFNHLEKYWSMGRIIPYIMENKKCLKPPTSSIFYLEDHNHPVSHEKNNPFPCHPGCSVNIPITGEFMMTNKPVSIAPNQVSHQQSWVNCHISRSPESSGQKRA